MQKILLCFSVLLLVSACVSFKNEPAPSSPCDSACRHLDYSMGQCLSAGSALDRLDPCGQKKGVVIYNESAPIKDCDFKAIGSWEVCCCFK